MVRSWRKAEQQTPLARASSSQRQGVPHTLVSRTSVPKKHTRV
jgi:hypothetical protein